MLGALGEAIERYAIAIYRESDLIRGSWREMETTAIDPRRLIFFADEQYAWRDFPYVRFEGGTVISWVRGTSLLDGRERLVPASRVHTPYRAPRPAERLLQSTSTGAASHVCQAEAILGGLYECIERDAVMIAWLNRLPLPSLDPSNVGRSALEATIELLAARGLGVQLFDATSDLGVPTVLALILGADGRVPAMAVGAATRATIDAAAEKAVVEAAHTFFWIHTRCRERGLPTFREDYADVTSLDLHSLLYGDPRMRAKVAFLMGETPARARWRNAAARVCDPVAPEATETELARCVARLRTAELDAVVVDVTPRDIRDAGFVVVRVVVEDLHPLWGGHQVRCLGGRRVREVPMRLGYFDQPRAVDELNGDPHPMP